MRDERVLAFAIHFIPAIQSQSLILPFVGFPLFSSEKSSNNHVDLNLLEATLLEAKFWERFWYQTNTTPVSLVFLHSLLLHIVLVYLSPFLFKQTRSKRGCMNVCFCRICLSVPFYVRHTITLPCHATTRQKEEQTNHHHHRRTRSCTIISTDDGMA